MMVVRSSSALARASSEVALTKVATPDAAVSPGTLSGVPFDLHRYRTIFPNRWAALLKAHFKNNEEIRAFFGVDEKTVRNWKAGKTGPQGWAVAVATDNITGAQEQLSSAA